MGCRGRRVQPQAFVCGAALPALCSFQSFLMHCIRRALIAFSNVLVTLFFVGHLFVGSASRHFLVDDRTTASEETGIDLRSVSALNLESLRPPSSLHQSDSESTRRLAVAFFFLLSGRLASPEKRRQENIWKLMETHFQYRTTIIRALEWTWEFMSRVCRSAA